MVNSTQDTHFSTNFQSTVNPAIKEPQQDIDPFSGGRYLKAFDHIDGIDQCSHHILIYLGSRMPYDQGTFVGIQVWPSIATISQCTKMDSSTVRRKVHKLVELGYLTSKRNKRINNAGNWEQGSNSYALTEKAFLQYAISVHQKTLVNAEESAAEKVDLERKIRALNEKLVAFESGEERGDMTLSNSRETPVPLINASVDSQEADNPFAEIGIVADLQSVVTRGQTSFTLPPASSPATSTLSVCPPFAQCKPDKSTATGFDIVPSLCTTAIPLQPAITPVAHGCMATGQERGGGETSARPSLAGRETNSPFKSPLKSSVKSSSRLQARTYDPLDRQLIVEEEFEIGRFDNVIAELSRQYATYFGINPSKGDIDRFCAHFLDLCTGERGADEELLARVYADMKWVHDRPHLHRSVKSINFVWHMAKMRDKDEIYTRQISHFISSLVREGKSIEEAFRSSAKAMNLNLKCFVDWAKEHLPLEV